MPRPSAAPSTPARPALVWIGRLGLALAPFVIAAAALETWFRIKDDVPWHQALEDEQFARQKIDPKLNSMRFRDREYRCPPLPGRARVLFLGDSFTYGVGVEDDERFTELLEVRFNENKPRADVVEYEFLNAGISGSLTDEWWTAFRGPGARFAPQVVVAVFFLRDGTTLGFRKDLFNPVREKMESWRENSRLAQYSAAWRAFRGQQLADETSRWYLEEFDRQYFGDDEQTAEWRNAQANLLKMRDACHKKRIQFHLVIFPLLLHLQGTYPLQAVCDEIERFGAESNIPTFSLLPAFQGQRARDLWVSNLDQHPNPRGHVLAADALEPYLRKSLSDR